MTSHRTRLIQLIPLAKMPSRELRKHMDPHLRANICETTPNLLRGPFGSRCAAEGGR